MKLILPLPIGFREDAKDVFESPETLAKLSNNKQASLDDFIVQWYCYVLEQSHELKIKAPGNLLPSECYDLGQEYLNHYYEEASLSLPVDFNLPNSRVVTLEVLDLDNILLTFPSTEHEYERNRTENLNPRPGIPS